MGVNPMTGSFDADDTDLRVISFEREVQAHRKKNGEVCAMMALGHFRVEHALKALGWRFFRGNRQFYGSPATFKGLTYCRPPEGEPLPPVGTKIALTTEALTREAVTAYLQNEAVRYSQQSVDRMANPGVTSSPSWLPGEFTGTGESIVYFMPATGFAEEFSTTGEYLGPIVPKR